MTRVTHLLLLLVLQHYVEGIIIDEQEDRIDEIMAITAGLTTDVEMLKSLVQTLIQSVASLNQNVQDQALNMKALQSSLAENGAKIDSVLSGGGRARPNTSKIEEGLVRLESKIDQSFDVLNVVHEFTSIRDCADMYVNGGRRSGVYTIYPTGGFRKSAYCEMSNGGGWTVIQKRFDGSVDFFRGWEEYAHGFGDPAGEYWLGLRIIRALTEIQAMKLNVGVTDFALGSRFAKYSLFSVCSEKEKFRLFLGNYSGNAGDSLRNQNGQPFSTPDQDNDPFWGSCSDNYHGAWWYKDCHLSNLNGRFSASKQSDPQYMSWYHLHNDYTSMKESVMMIRPATFKP